MTKAFSPCLKSTDWSPLYRSAILESNKRVLPRLVSQAEAAVVARAREIFYSDGTAEEKEALEDALLCPACVQNRMAARRSCVIP
jgi:hypothetical protein